MEHSKAYSQDEVMALIASMTGPLFSKIKLVMKNALKNVKLAQNDHILAVIELLSEQLVPQYCAANMGRGDKLATMHSLVFLLASKAQSVFTSGVVRTCIDQNWDLKGFKSVLLRILKEIGLAADSDTAKLKEFFDKLIQSQNLQSQSCIKAISLFLKNPKKPIEEDDLKNPAVSFQSNFEFVKADVERYRAQQMKYECFQVLHPWAYDLDQVDFKYVINKDQTTNICKVLKSQEARIFWLSYFKAQLAASADEFIGALREYCIMNHIPEHFSARYETDYKVLMLKTNFVVTLAQHSLEIEDIILEAHNEAKRRYSGCSLLNGDQVKLPGGSARLRIPANQRSEYIAEDKLGRAYKLQNEAPYYDTIKMGNIKSWSLSEEQARIRLDMSRGTFRVVTNARQENKLTLRFTSVDTEELKDLEVRIAGDTAQYKVGEGDCNHFVIANDKKLWESQFMIVSRDGKYYIRDLGVVHTSRLKVTGETALQLHQGALIDLGKVVHYHVNKLTHATQPTAHSSDTLVIMRNTSQDYKVDDEPILRARPAWVSADENRDMVQNEIMLEASSKQAKFSIGRSNRRDVELKLKAVSADHCKIEYTSEKGWLIHEQGKERLSSNGTFVFMKSHQQMEDHEPSDLIPLFNGMIISFINYELQVRIEAKSADELAHARFEDYGMSVATAKPAEKLVSKVKNAFAAEPTPAPVEVPHQEEQKQSFKSSNQYSEHFEGTAAAKNEDTPVQEEIVEVVSSHKPSEIASEVVASHREPVVHKEPTPRQPPTVEELTEEIWAEFDTDHSGALSRAETRKFVIHLLQKLGEEPKINEEDFNELFKEFDEDNNGTVSKDEMALFIRQSRGLAPLPEKKPVHIPEPEPTVQEVVAEALANPDFLDETPEKHSAPLTEEQITDQIWAKYDKDNSGSLDKAETKNFIHDLLSKLGEEPKISEEQFNELFADFDQNANGTISKEEMAHFIKQARGQEPLPEKKVVEETQHQEVAQVEERVNVEEPKVEEPVHAEESVHVEEAKVEEPPVVEKAPPTEEELTAEIWAQYDKDNSGALNKAETRKFVQDLLVKLGEEPKISEQEFAELFADFDENANGTISKDEMALFIKQARGQEPLPEKKAPVHVEPEHVEVPKVEESVHVEEPKVEEPVHVEEAKVEEPPVVEKAPPTVEEMTAEIWAEFDKDNSGALNKTETRKFVLALLVKLGEQPKISEAEFNDLFKDFDEDNNGTVSKDEMALFIRQSRGEEPLPEKKADPVQEPPHVEEAKPVEEVKEEDAPVEEHAPTHVEEAHPPAEEAKVEEPVAEAHPAPVEEHAPAHIEEAHPVEEVKAEEPAHQEPAAEAKPVEEAKPPVEEEAHPPAEEANPPAEEEAKLPTVDSILDEIWNKFDKDNSGTLSKSETRAFLKDMLIKLGEDGKLSEAEFNEIFKDFDDDQSGTVTKDEMRTFILHARARAISQEQ